MSKSWSATLKLPKSTFPPRPVPKLREQYLQQCTDNLYEWQRQNLPAEDTFVIHDGPPYANGKLHVGHALNKILKDMILRTKIQQGRRVNYIPGWDCHGLPIELKALENSKNAKLTPIEIRKSARNLASNTILKQMKAFRSFGVMGDWDQRWTTMDAEFEMRQLRLFQQMVKKGLIYRRFKPVYWSPSSKTALAEAELEYRDDHVSNSAWVRFQITDDWRTLPQFHDIQALVEGNLYAVTWTTTPWTLPANRAIAIHEDLEYCIVLSGVNALLVAKSRVDTFTSKIGAKDHVEVLGTLPGTKLAGLKYFNRLRGKTGPPQPIIHANFVSADSGSGLVHLAPGHGFDDYEVCRSLGIPVVAPIDDHGRFTEDAFPDLPEALLSSPSVIEGGGQDVLSLLQVYADVLWTEKHTHKYPYDWRTKQPVIIRATEQWFADVESIKKEALKSLQNIRFIPTGGKKRLESFIQGRSEWCISRQRAWGVPIPALYDDKGAAVVNEEVVEHIISLIQERGTQAWWSDAADDIAWIPPSLRDQGEYRRGTDTMDVWFDSGSSWTMMSGRADVYLEGTDQHRGWFQSSLLTRIAAGAQEDGNFEKGAPFKQLITHGFTLDQDGRKMSKSLGNIIDPQEVMDGSILPPVKPKKNKAAAQAQPTYDALGPDALRLWAASSTYTRDVAISAPVLSAIHAALIKYRVIVKMLLGSMHKSARTSPLSVLDHIAIIQLQDTMKEVGEAFDNHEFHKGYAVLNRWISVDLSAFYLEALKDRLYCGDGGGVIEPVLTGLLRMLAPMAPLIVEEAWDHRPEWVKEDPSFTYPFHQFYTDPIIDPSRLTHDLTSLREDIPVLMSVHGTIQLCLENARNDKNVGQSLQCSVNIRSKDAVLLKVLQKYKDELESIFVVSSVQINSPADVTTEWSYARDFVNGVEGQVTVLPPTQAKCPRCWRYTAPKEDTLCQRCEAVV
ncbi:isoleucyl-tRNA synthetase [Annulohypoxylon maeteangense]|uniref:isoleucyl-tRNA synthetase n=1 Tax=Annulohypoxylon maeteangense TaxID=1927788 RepID=UPI0020074DD7|nr:isoleucyl-tRNA synthetase [Annulohypoxylon maeteangense]KAI0881268.1 isoleucyl-tRNA synthetase [Annulohypoxylon maeteangense]